MQGFLSFLHEQDVENDYQIVLEYVAENFDYEDEEELEELLQSLDEDDIEYILDEASKFSTTKNLNYTPSGNQKGASEPTPPPKVTVSRPSAPAKKVKTQSSGESERRSGQAPKGDKPSASKPEQPPAQEPERPKAAKPQQRRLQKTSDPSTMPKEEPKKETPSASTSSDKPKRKTFKATVKQAGVISSGKKTSERTSPEAKARAKKVKRYLKKGTSAKKVQQYVNRERKRLGKEAKAKEAEAKKQQRAQRSQAPKPEAPKATTQPANKPAPKKPKVETPAAENKPEKKRSKISVRAGRGGKAIISTGKIGDAKKRATPEYKDRAKKAKTNNALERLAQRTRERASKNRQDDRRVPELGPLPKVNQYDADAAKKATQSRSTPSGGSSRHKDVSEYPSRREKVNKQLMAARANKPSEPEKSSSETSTRRKKSKLKLSGVRKRGYVKGARSDYEVRKPEQRGTFKAKVKKAGTTSGGGVNRGVGDAKELSSKKEVRAYVSKNRRGSFKSSKNAKGTISSKGAPRRKAGDSVEPSSKERVKSYVSSKKTPSTTRKNPSGFGSTRTSPKIDKTKSSSSKPKKSLKDFIKGGISKAKSKLKKTARGALLKLARKLREDYDTCEFLALMLIQEGYAETIEDAVLFIEDVGIENFQEILSE